MKRVPVRFRLVVTLRQQEGAHRVAACGVNGSRAPMDSVFSHATVGARLTETVFDLSGVLHEGRNTITCRLRGVGVSSISMCMSWQTEGRDPTDLGSLPRQ